MSPPSESEPIEVQPVPTGPGLKAGDVLYILFRHKWLIAICAAVGIGAAGAGYALLKPSYVAVAKLLVKAVVDAGYSGPAGSDGQVRNLNASGESVMNAELEILTSKDLTRDVVDALGMQVFADVWPTLTNRDQVATAILKNLNAENPRRGTTITVSFDGKEPEFSQKVLGELVERYLLKHVSVHGSVGIYEELAKTTDQIRARMDDTEKEIRQLREKANISSGSLDEAKAAVGARLALIQNDVRQASASLSEQKARMEELSRWRNVRNATTSPNTDAPPVAGEGLVSEYRQLMDTIAQLQARRNALLGQFTSDSPFVKQIQSQLDENLSKRTVLERDHPELVRLGIASTPGSPAVQQDLSLEGATLAAIEARFATLTNQYETALAESKRIEDVAFQLARLEQQRSSDRTNLVSLSARLEQAKFTEALDPSRMPNISVIQKPAVFLEDNKKAKKILVGIALAGVALGVGLAFLIELVLDQRVKKPSDVEVRAGLPLLLSIPAIKGLGKFDLALPAVASPDRRASESPVPILPSLMAGNSVGGQGPRSRLPAPDSAVAAPDMAPWQAQHVLRPYFEALRDRLMLYFQLNRMHHKPKLVAVAGCGEGSGTTTIAAGLAASLSETGDGNVLLVDMNLGRGAVHPFFRGRPGAALTDALEPQLRDEGQVQDKLFVASAHTEADDSIRPLPKRFHSLMPKMRASDYDYIIFDMPAISETSATVALAASMDQVLLVVEGDKTQRGEVKRAHDMLRRYGANVVGVFNKQQDHAPKWLSDST